MRRVANSDFLGSGMLDLENVGMRQLRYFVTAADAGSFRKAAVHLGIRESAISRGIRDLEDSLGASMFHRHNSGIGLTVAGRRFLRGARLFFRQLNDAVMDVAAVGRSERGQLKIGIFSSLASGFLSELLRGYGRLHSGIRLELIEGNPAEHVAAIRKLDLDIAFVTGTGNWQDCEVDQFWQERVFAVLPAFHPLAVKHEVEWRDLSTENFIVSEGAPGPEIHDYLVQRLAELGHHPEIHTQQVGRDNLLSLVAVGRGLTVMSEAGTAAQFPGIIYRPIMNEVLPFSAIWSAQNDNPACRRLLSLARSMSHPSRQSGFNASAFLAAESASHSRIPGSSP